MAKTTAKLSPNFERIVTEAARPAIEQFAEDVLETARKLAPVGTKAEGSRHPGSYKESLHIKKLPDGKYHIIADVKHATFVEFGRHSAKGQRVLGRALISTPLRSTPRSS